jgi:hypothetical protein
MSSTQLVIEMEQLIPLSGSIRDLDLVQKLAILKGVTAGIAVMHANGSSHLSFVSSRFVTDLAI